MLAGLRQRPRQRLAGGVQLVTTVPPAACVNGQGSALAGAIIEAPVVIQVLNVYLAGVQAPCFVLRQAQ